MTPEPEFSFFSKRTYSVAQVRVQTVQESTVEGLSLCNQPQHSVAFFNDVVAKAEWFDADKECVVIILLDVKYRVKGWSLISIGTQTACMLHPREVLRAALVGNAFAFVLMHNHPSGDPMYSSSDMKTTRDLRGAATAVDITMLDHVIVGRPESDPLGCGYYSFCAAGLC
jgi:DNA repair protein RadC